MDAMFLKILNMSITGSYMILAVMVVRLFLKKAPKKYSYLLWLVCGFRLCCPVSIRTMFSIFQLRIFSMPSGGGASLEHIPENIGLMRQPEISTGLDAMDRIVNPLLPAPRSYVSSANPMQIVLALASLVWLTGITLLLLYSLISWVMLRIRLKDAILYQEHIYQTDRISSPFVFGLLRPRIYLPFGIARDEMDDVLSHEQYHIKRR